MLEQELQVAVQLLATFFPTRLRIAALPAAIGLIWNSSIGRWRCECGGDLGMRSPGDSRCLSPTPALKLPGLSIHPHSDQARALIQPQVEPYFAFVITTPSTVAPCRRWT